MAAPKILVVEDDREAGDLLARIFEVDEYSVLRASDGARALELVQSERPDLVLLDLELPIMDGREFLRWLRIDPNVKDTFVVAVSGAQDSGSCGADACITKPLSLEQLRRVLSLVHRRAPLELSGI